MVDFTFEKYKGIHPGLVLDRELKKRQLKRGTFAVSLQAYPQILNEITKGRRGLTPALSLRIDHALGLEDGTMLLLQTYYEIKKEKQKGVAKDHPDLSKLRKLLFWDTNISKIDWHKQYKAVIERVFQRGNSQEKEEILTFYGKDKVESIIGKSGIESNRFLVLPHLKTK